MAEYKFSILEYTPVDGDEKKQVVIPTIQDISVNDTNMVLSKPTITGQTVSQTSTRKPTTVTISILLQVDSPTYTYLNQEFTTKELISDLRSISDNNLIFDLITTNSNLTTPLSDLVIVSKSFAHSATRRNAVVYTLNCTEIRFAKVGWNLVPKAEVLGVDVTTSEDTEQVIPLTMSMQIDGEDKFKYANYFTFLNLTPPSITGEFITTKRGWSNIPPYYLSLNSPIDLTNTGATYLVDTAFPLAIWGEYIDGTIGTKGAVITDFADFGTLKIKIYAEGIVEFNDSGINIGHSGFVGDYSTLETRYDVINQYRGFSEQYTFEKFISQKNLMHEVGLKYDNGFYVDIANTILTGNALPTELVLKSLPTSYNVMAKPISERYKFTISNSISDMEYIDGSAKSYELYETKLPNINIPELVGISITSGSFNTPENLSAYLYAIIVGTNMYLFIFSTDIFTDSVLPGVKSI